MSFCNIEVDELKQVQQTDVNVCGATLEDSITFRELAFIPSDSTTIFVDSTAGSDTNNGNQLTPVKTLIKVVELIDTYADPLKRFIHLVSAGTLPYPFDFRNMTHVSGNPIVIQSELGYKPQLYLYYYSWINSLGPTDVYRRYHLETYDSLLFVSSDIDVSVWDGNTWSAYLAGAQPSQIKKHRMRPYHTINVFIDRLLVYTPTEGLENFYYWNIISNDFVVLSTPLGGNGQIKDF